MADCGTAWFGVPLALNNPPGTWTIVVSVAIAAITLASWALRPQDRRLADPVKRAEVAGLSGSRAG